MMRVVRKSGRFTFPSALLLVLLLVGCGSAAPVAPVTVTVTVVKTVASGAPTSPPATVASSPPTFTTCSLFQNGAGVTVVVHASDASTACRTLAQDWTKNGVGVYSFWRWQAGDYRPVMARTSLGVGKHLCTATAKTGATISVYDNGLQEYGNSFGNAVCQVLTAANGWTVS